MIHARRLAIATSDELRATAIGQIAVVDGLVDSWRWYETPDELVREILTDETLPSAVVIDHVSRAETITACRAVREYAGRKLPILATFNGQDVDPATALDLRAASVWIPRRVLLRDLSWLLGAFGVRA